MSSEVKTILIFSLITLILIIGGVSLLGRSGSTSQNAAPVDPKLLVREDSHKIASDSAKLTVVEFGDYECPACQAAQPVSKQIIKDYAGKINYVFRNFPLPQHTKGLISAEAAEAAGAQGKFWEMHDKLYETQEVWVVSDKPLDLFAGYAQELGLDVNRFREEVSANKYQDRITGDYNDGTALGIRATPTFFIGTERLEGVPTYNEFKAKLDAALSAK